MYLVSLLEAMESDNSPHWFRSNEDLAKKYGVGEHSVSDGLNELASFNIVEIYRSKPFKFNRFEERLANEYRNNPLKSYAQFSKELSDLKARLSIDLVENARKLALVLNEGLDIEIIETYVGLIEKYGHERVKQINQVVSSKRREAGWRSVGDVISSLRGTK